MLASTCARCGWDESGDACQELVYSVPTIHDTSYMPCWNASFEFAKCVEQESCICGGEVPAACQQIQANLAACLKAGMPVEPNPISADWIDVQTRCGFGFSAPPDYRDTPVRGTDSCVLEFTAADCQYSADYGAFAGPFSDHNCSARAATIDGHEATITSCEGDREYNYLSGIHFADVGRGTGVRLTMVAKCRTPRGHKAAQALFGSLHF